MGESEFELGSTHVSARQRCEIWKGMKVRKVSTDEQAEGNSLRLRRGLEEKVENVKEVSSVVAKMLMWAWAWGEGLPGQEAAEITGILLQHQGTLPGR